MKKILLTILVLFCACGHNVFIEAVVGSRVISSKDVDEAIDIAKSPMFGKAYNESNIREVVLDSLIEQALVLNFADEYQVSVLDVDITNYLKNMFKAEDLSVIYNKMKDVNLSFDKILGYAKSQVAWKKIVNEFVVSSVFVSDDEILEWHEQMANNRYNKIYTIYSLSFGGKMIDSNAYLDKIDCGCINSFAEKYNFSVGNKLSLHFSEMSELLKSQIMDGIKEMSLSKPINKNEFFVLCSVENANNLNDDDVYKIIFENKVRVGSNTYLKKIKEAYYAKNKY